MSLQTISLKEAYSQPHRHYHTLTHIMQCLKLLDAVDLSDYERWILTIAIWWHDVVYDPTAKDNEAQSAALAVAELDIPAHVCEEVERLILLTAEHQVSSTDRLGAIMVSIDLAILGSSWEDYQRYAQEVRAEYAHVSDEAWRLGRPSVLQSFLDAPNIYPYPEFRACYEVQARANIEREIASLS